MILNEKIIESIKETVESNGYSLSFLGFVKEDGNLFLRVAIDKEGGVTLEDCVTTTHLVNPILDENEALIKEQYILDVCSKGTEE